MEISHWISHVKNKAKKKVHESWDFNGRIRLVEQSNIYPLANIQKSMEHHHFIAW